MNRFLFASAAALLLLAGAPFQSVLALDDGVSAHTVLPRRPIKTDPVNIGPDLNAGATLLTPNDVVALDQQYNGSTSKGALINFATSNNGTGTETILASGTVGSGTNYAANEVTLNSAVAPNGTVYYLEGNGTFTDFVAVNPSTKVRTRVSDGSNASLGPQTSASIFGMTWDFATNTIVYLDFGTAFGSATTGIYRLDPATGIRTVVSTNGSGSGYVLYRPTYIVTDAFGNIFYLDTDTQSGVTHFRAVVQLPVIANSFGANGYPNYGARKVVSSNTVGSQTGGTYQDLIGLSIDTSQPQTITGGLPTAQSLIVVDQGTSQTNSAIYRVPSDTGAKTKVISFNSTNANTGTAVFDLPSSSAVDTTGRIYYGEYHNGANDLLTVIPAGTHAAATLTGATGLGINNVPIFNIVPPPVPVLATGTTSSLLGTSVTLTSNITADGGSAQSPVTANAGIISRGFVYALTSTNANPRIGGTGVTQASNLNVTALPVTTGTNLGAFSSSISGLSQGASYTFSAYAQDQAGYGYSTPVTFVTPTPPTVTSPTVTAITGTSATLGGNVTSDGGGTITARGVVYSVTSTNSTPVIGGSGVTNVTATGTTGVFTVNATGLANGTNYTFRAYATNAVGTTYTGLPSAFTTIAAPTANSQSVTTAFNTAKAITLTGSDPNTPAQTLTYTVVTTPTHGTLSGTAPNVTYTPTANYQGSDSFTFQTTNTSSLSSNTATVSITVTPGTPTANAQSVSVPFNTATGITLTGSDPDSPALSLTYTVATTPTHGTLSGTAPNLTYTPTAGYQGSDSFTFTVSNGTNTSSPATVSITVAAGTPTANSQSVTTAFNTAKAITLTGSDPNSPALTLTYTVATAPTHGTLSGTAPNLTYTPTANYQGTDSFTFTVSNGQKTSAAATVSITVSPGTPTANSQSVSVPFNTATAVTLTGTDPDSPALSLTYTVLTPPTHGTLSGTVPNLTYTPTANYQGTDSFTFRVSNGTNLSNTATVSITVAAGTPTANSQSVSVPHATATAVTLTGTDPDSPALALTYTVATAPAHGTLSGTAPNLTYTPASTYQGVDSFTFTVSNGQKTSAAATVSLTVAAGTPTANSQSGLVVLLNTPTAITLSGTDPDSPALSLTYTVATAPANGTLSGTAPNLTYTPTTGYTGTDSFTFTVSNGQKTSTAATVSLTVVGQPYVTGFTPSGAVGSTVTLTGNNFLGTTAVTFFRNVPATTFTVVSDTQLTAVVPTGAKTGVITITNGLGTNTTPTKFTVTP